MRRVLIAFIGVSFLADLLTGLPALAQQMDEAIQRGQNVFKRNKCSVCHSIEGKGGRIGPDLSQVGSRREAAWLQTFLKDPRSVIPQGKQPPFKGTAEEREELVTYLSSLR
jgi:nitric oxide reductase subunit C